MNETLGEREGEESELPSGREGEVNETPGELLKVTNYSPPS